MTGIQDAWADASVLVARALPDAVVTLEWPGTVIDVQVANSTLLVFGTNSDTIGADVDERYGDTWQYLSSPDALDTDVSSDTSDADLIARTIVEAVQRWAAERDNA